MIVRNLLQKQGERGRRIRRNLYIINVNRERNCYSCGGFDYLVRNYKNQRIVDQDKRIGYKNNLNIMNNLKKKESLVVLN